MGRSKSSKRWLAEHFDDPYVKQAQREGWRGRAAFKLIEIDDRQQLLRGCRRIVDLGAAPGAWCQVARARAGEDCRIYALDLLPMKPVDGVHFIQGDFTEDGPLAQLEEALQGQAVDLVLSDMAPNISGMSAVDQPRAMYLSELALEFALQWLKPGGDFLVKVFQGEGSDAFLKGCREHFEKARVIKPAASRPRSREVYVLGRGFQPQ
jgi:23S rRNA (uridine2552-2'-O)-methyltransferase